MDTSLDFDHDTAIVTYQQLITEIPPLNRQLLLYILDLLAVFASKSDVNLMTSANLAAIFQPGVLSHPIHDMSPEAYRLSQDVLIFLIDNQDSFLIGMSGTAADEKTVRDVQSGAIPQQPSTPSKSGLVESVSNASIAGEGKRYSGIRRNVSTSSRNSRQSSQGLSTPLVGHFNNSVVHRSNTVPSKKSPAIPTTRFNRGIDSPNSPLAQSPAIGGPLTRANAVTTAGTQEEDQSMNAKPVIEGLGLNQPALPSASGLVANDSRDKSRTTENNNTATGTLTQLLPLTTMNRKVSDVLLNLTGGSDKDGRQPNKLKKKRLPSNLNASGNSSAASLVGGEPSPAFPSTRSPLRTPDISASDRTDPLVTTTTNLADLSLLANESEPQTPIPTSSNAPLFSNSEASGTLKTPVMSEHAQTLTDPALMARSASRTSAHSKSSVTDLSELDHDQTDQARAEHKEKRRIWRFSHSANKSKSPARVSNNTGAGQSSSSVGSWHRSRKSISNDTNPSAFEPVPSMPTASTVLAVTGSKARSRSRDQDNDGDTEEKQGFFDKLKKKVNQVREDKKERDAEKERAKSPMRETEQSSKPSLPAIVNESTSPIRPSVVQQTIPETRESDNTITEVAMVQKTEPRESKSTNVEPASLPPIIIPPPTVSPSTPIATTEPNTSIQTQVSTTGTQTSDLVLMKDVSTATETATSLTTAPTTSSDQP